VKEAGYEGTRSLLHSTDPAASHLGGREGAYGERRLTGRMPSSDGRVCAAAGQEGPGQRGGWHAMLTAWVCRPNLIGDERSSRSCDKARSWLATRAEKLRDDARARPLSTKADGRSWKPCRGGAREVSSIFICARYYPRRNPPISEASDGPPDGRSGTSRSSSLRFRGWAAEYTAGTGRAKAARGGVRLCMVFLIVWNVLGRRWSRAAACSARRARRRCAWPHSGPQDRSIRSGPRRWISVNHGYLSPTPVRRLGRQAQRPAEGRPLREEARPELTWTYDCATGLSGIAGHAREVVSLHASIHSAGARLDGHGATLPCPTWRISPPPTRTPSQARARAPYGLVSRPWPTAPTFPSGMRSASPTRPQTSRSFRTIPGSGPSS